MASKPRDLVVRFLSDVQGFLRGTDQVSDALEDVARDQARLADKGETAARDLARAYERAGDKIVRDAKDTNRKTSAQFADAGKEAGDEFAQNLGESISSGDLSGLISGTVGGLVGTFGKGGPIALAIGALGAVGVGVFQQLQASAEAAAAAAQAAFDNLQSGAEELASTQTQLETAFGKGDYVSNLKEAQKLSAKVGLDWKTVVALISDGNKGQDEYNRLLGIIEEVNRKSVETAGDLSVKDSDRRLAAQQIADAVARSSDALNAGLKAYEDTRTYLGQGADAAERQAAAINRAKDDSATLADNMRLAAFYAEKGSSYAVGGSTWQQQLGAAAPYATGRP